MANINLKDGNGITFSLSTSGNTLTINIDKNELNSILADLADDPNSEIKKILDSSNSLDTRIDALADRIEAIETVLLNENTTNPTMTRNDTWLKVLADRITGIENAVVDDEPHSTWDTDTITWKDTSALIEYYAGVLDDNLEAKLIGKSSDASSANTIYGAKNYSTSKDHSHSNKSTLDTYNQTNADIKAAIEAKHSHSNKSTLDDVSTTWVRDLIISKYDGTKDTNDFGVIDWGTKGPGDTNNTVNTNARIFIKYEASK